MKGRLALIHTYEQHVQARLAAKLESVLDGLFVPNVTTLETRKRSRIGDPQHRINHGVVSDFHNILQGRGSEGTQRGALGRNDRAFSLVILGRK